MIQINIESAYQACLNNDLESLKHLVPGNLSPNSRVLKFRIGERPHSSVPFLCVAIASGSLDCFDYLIENGATTYFADLIYRFIISSIIII